MAGVGSFSSAALQRHHLAWYEALARKTVGADGWTFMNYGYGWGPEDGPPPPPPPNAHVMERDAAAMYWTVAHQDGPLDGRRVLEVGSGRGGGAAYLSANTKLARYVGIDLAPAAVALANRRHAQPGRVEFVAGDAERLPFEAAEFDVVINVESSHCYGNPARFFSGAAHVLAPGGALLWCDFRSQRQLEPTRAMIRRAGLTIEREDDISKAVLAGVDARPNDEIDQILQTFAESPEHLRLLREFSLLPGAVTHHRLVTGVDVYLRAVLRKPRAADDRAP